MDNCIAYEGPSRLGGGDIIAIITGLARHSANPKAPFPQMYILPKEGYAGDRPVSTCGTCRMRGFCYVRNDSLAGLHRAVERGSYVTMTVGHLTALSYQGLRLCAFGDPAALPVEVVTRLCVNSRDTPFTCYTEEWRTADHLRPFSMASTHTREDTEEARALGWRTFQVVAPCPCTFHQDHRGKASKDCPLCDGWGTAEPLLPDTCPCHSLGGRFNCQSCPAPCNGGKGPNYYIPAHGNKARKFLEAYFKRVTT